MKVPPSHSIFTIASLEIWKRVFNDKECNSDLEDCEEVGTGAMCVHRPQWGSSTLMKAKKMMDKLHQESTTSRPAMPRVDIGHVKDSPLVPNFILNDPVFHFVYK